ncbi:MAG: T9SS type A sorting domain-containing protein [Cyclobacteriaceae bacterium]
MIRKLSLFILVCLWGLGSKAQIVEFPIGGGAQAKTSTHATRFLSIQALDTLSLPFWDDFSATLGTPDSSQWVSSENVNINQGRGLNPPSINVATFDGTDRSGIPYGSGEDQGSADTLTSQPINLSGLTSGQQNSLFLSFFWQKRGNGEIPDSEDSLRLQFKNNLGQWITQWVEIGGDSLNIDQFQLELIQVPPGAFQHSGFQFRFQSFGKLTGGYDNWHLDYIFLNAERSAADIYFQNERTITLPPTSIFDSLTALPIDHFFADPNAYIGEAAIQVFSLEAPQQTNNVRMSALIKVDGAIVDLMNDTTEITPEGSPVFRGQDRFSPIANPVDVASLAPFSSLDSLVITTEFSIKTDDTTLFRLDDPLVMAYDLRVNDTVRSQLLLQDFYAYDDGSAELGAGVNQTNGQLVNRFIIGEEDVLKEVDIYFPFIEEEQSGKPARLVVWGNLDPGAQPLLNQAISIGIPDSLDQFSTYELSRQIRVTDTIYVGVRQTEITPIVVGLDKSNNTGDNIFFNTSGIWEQNQRVTGSLMIRPRFGGEIIVGLPDAPPIPSKETEYILYPNPASKIFRLQGDLSKVTEVKAYDLQGRHVGIQLSQEGTLELQGNAHGLYIIQIHTEQKTITQKILINQF